MALRHPDPLAFPLSVSAILAATDTRDQDPLALSKDDHPVLDELVELFLEFDVAETTAALHAIAAMVVDDVMAARIRRTLSTRRQPVPPLTRHLGSLVVTDVIGMTHVLGDGDDLILDVHGTDGERLTFLVYVDHNLGTLVKDAFVFGEPIDDVVDFFRRESAGQVGVEFAAVDLADTRERLIQAIDLGSSVWPPIETDTWPGCRALLEMVVRGMPEGGTGYEEPEYDADDEAMLVRDFLASPSAADLDPDPQGRDASLVEGLVEIATDTFGDPLRWSPSNVEILLIDWFAFAVYADEASLRRMPAVLRAFVRYCHARRSIPQILTDETLAAVDEGEPAYLETIANPVLRESMREFDALIATLLAPREHMLAVLAQGVGGLESLMALDDVPLPDEELDMSRLPADIHGRVREVAALVDGFAAEYFDTEFRTACRRFLSRAAENDPAAFRRRSRSDTAAAAIVWAVGKANGLVASSGGLQSGQLMAHFGLTGSPSQRAGTLLAAIGVDPDARFGGEVLLGAPGLLTSECRAAILASRDVYTD